MNNKRACLLIHGFTGGPFEIEPLGAHLQKNGWVCHMPILPGHEEHLSHLKSVHRQDWINAIEREAQEITDQHEQFDLIGFSMGGFLAAYIANRYPVRRLVLLNTALIYVSPGRFASETMAQIRNRDWSQFHKIGTVPLRSTWQFMHLIRNLRLEIRRLKVPTLIIQGEKDQVVHPYSARVLDRMMNTEREIRFFAKSRHLICHDVEAEYVFNDVLRFLWKGLKV